MTNSCGGSVLQNGFKGLTNDETEPSDEVGHCIVLAVFVENIVHIFYFFVRQCKDRHAFLQVKLTLCYF